MKKKILSIALALTMALSMLPSAALAANVDEVNNNPGVETQADINLTVADAGSAKLFGNETATDLQSDIKATDLKVTGTSKLVTGYTDFSSKTEEQSGHYIALKLTAGTGDKIEFKSIDVAEGEYKTLGDDGILVWRITQDDAGKNKNIEVKITPTGDNPTSTTATIDLSGVKLDSGLEITAAKQAENATENPATPPLCEEDSYTATLGEDGTTVTVEAKQIKEHTNGAKPEGVKGYWIGATFKPKNIVDLSATSGATTEYVVLYKNGDDWAIDTDSCDDGSIVSQYLNAFTGTPLAVNKEAKPITVGVFPASAVTEEGTVAADAAPISEATYEVKASEKCTKDGDVEVEDGLTVESAAESDALIAGDTKKVSDLQTNVTATGLKVSGTSKYIDDYSAFAEGAKGNFVALKLTTDIMKADGTTAEDITVTMSDGTTTKKLDDGILIWKITPKTDDATKTDQKIKVTVGTGEAAKEFEVDLSGLTLETETPAESELTVALVADDTDLLGKKAADLHGTGVKVEKDATATEGETWKATGSLKYVDDYSGFSSVADETKGNYIALKFTTTAKDKDDATKAATITVNDKALDADGILIRRVTAENKETPLTVKVNDTELKVDLSGLTLETEIPAESELTVALVADDTDLLGKKAADLHGTGVKVEKDATATEGETWKATGSLKYVDDYSGFSSVADETKGNYIALKFTTTAKDKDDATKAATITVNDKALDADGILIRRVTAENKETPLTVKVNDTEAKIDLSGLTLEEDNTQAPAAIETVAITVPELEAGNSLDAPEVTATPETVAVEATAWTEKAAKDAQAEEDAPTAAAGKTYVTTITVTAKDPTKAELGDATKYTVNGAEATPAADESGVNIEVEVTVAAKTTAPAATVDENGTATTTVAKPEDGTIVADAPAKIDATEIVDADKDKDVTAVNVNLPKDAAAEYAKASNTTVKTPVGDVTLPQKAMSDISEAAGDQDATLVVAKTDKEDVTPGEGKEVKAAFNISVKVGDKDITIELGTNKYTLAFNVGTGLKNPKLYYVNPLTRAATKELGDELANIKYENGIISGEADKLGEVAVVDTLADEPTEQASITVTPATATIDLSTDTKTATLTAEVKDAAGNPVTNPNITWESSAPTIATVTDGVVTGVAVGEATITAKTTVNNKEVSGSAKITVKAGSEQPGENALALKSVSNHGEFVVKCQLENAQASKTYLVQITRKGTNVYFTVKAGDDGVFFFANKGDVVQAWEDGTFNEAGAPGGNGASLTETTVEAAPSAE